MATEQDLQGFFGGSLEQERHDAILGEHSLHVGQAIIHHYNELHRDPPTPLVEPIPFTIHFIWLGNNAMPFASSGDPRMNQCMESWRQHNPHWEMRLWTDADLQQQSWFNQEALEYAVNNRQYGMASDILRLELLWQHGGFYSDIDYLCVQSLDDLTTCHSFVCGASNTGCIEINNGLIGCTKEHPLIRQMMTNIKLWFHKFHQPIQRMAGFLDPATLAALNQAMSLTKMDVIRNTGPGVITKCVGEALVKQSNESEKEAIKSIVVLP